MYKVQSRQHEISDYFFYYQNSLPMYYHLQNSLQTRQLGTAQVTCGHDSLVNAVKSQNCQFVICTEVTRQQLLFTLTCK